MSDNTNVSTVTNEGGESLPSSISALSVVIPQIDLKALTESTIEGGGVYDALMRAVAVQLQSQWDKGYIVGQEYATVYTSAIVATLAQSVEFLQNQARLGYDLELAKANIEKVKADTAMTNLQNERLTAELAKVPIEIELLRKESLKSDIQTTLLGKQVDQLVAEVSKIPYEIVILEKQASNLESQKANTEATTNRIVEETLQKLPLEVAILDKEKESMDYKNQLVEAQAKLAISQVELAPVELELRRAQLEQTIKQSLILAREYDLKVGELALQERQLDLMVLQVEVQREELKVKMAQVLAQEAQSELYRQKVITERAQTDPSVILEGSVMGMNNEVLKGQVDAFKFDKINRAVKVHLDVFSTTYSIGDRTVNAQNGLTDTDIGKVMSAMNKSLDII